MTETRATAPTPLPQELTELLLELALALQRYGMYPGGHPSVDAAVSRLMARLGGILERQALLSLGVARRQLVIEGVATESTHPVLRALAEKLHRHRLGAVVFRRGLDSAELSSALRAVAADPDRSGEPLGTASAERLAEWPHVALYRVTYEQLQLSDGAAEGGSAVESAGASPQLWLGLAQAAVARSDGSGDARPVDTDPDAVVQAINEHPAAHAYDQMVVGYLVQLAEELRQDPEGAGAEGVRDRLSHMMRNLDPATLQRLLAMGGDRAQRTRFVSNATDVLSTDAVLEVVRAAADAEGENISTSMLRLLRKLSAFAQDDGVTVNERADNELRAQVKELIDGWTLSDPNPDQYTQKLELMARGRTAGARAGGARGAEQSRDGEDADTASVYGAEPLRIVQMGIEVGATGMTFWRAVDALLDEGRLNEIFEVMEVAGENDATVNSLWRRFERGDHVRRLLTTDPVDFDALDRIFARLPAATVISLLLDRISESASRATRMGIYQRLSARGVAAVPAIMDRLQDQRWYVLRNMLALLAEIDAWPAEFSPLAYARLAHAPVRREALTLAIRLPAERDAAICLALRDADERALRVGVRAAREHGLPQAAVPIVLQRLTDETLSTEARVAIIRLLPLNGSPDVCEKLCGLALQRGLLGRMKLADPAPEVLAALGVLARAAGSDPRARTAVELARASTDPDIRRAVAVKT